ncbi:hypothetical protein KSP39_PZI001210 [Platanthera zijinensis]|uniref:Uncharacterized protein n=1 Tax=Platanthera zijinensis TaxID=2320716 RepID=A0AAP0C4X0_9ASPA
MHFLLKWARVHGRMITATSLANDSLFHLKHFRLSPLPIHLAAFPAAASISSTVLLRIPPACYPFFSLAESSPSAGGNIIMHSDHAGDLKVELWDIGGNTGAEGLFLGSGSWIPFGANGNTPVNGPRAKVLWEDQTVRGGTHHMEYSQCFHWSGTPTGVRDSNSRISRADGQCDKASVMKWEELGAGELVLGEGNAPVGVSYRIVPGGIRGLVVAMDPGGGSDIMVSITVSVSAKS